MPETNSRFLYFIGGSKGGVGKSILSMILADFLTQCRRRKIILVESDTSNPDVGNETVTKNLNNINQNCSRV
jgi:cellulose biosynthesis protein BcsQ